MTVVVPVIPPPAAAPVAVEKRPRGVQAADVMSTPAFLVGAHESLWEAAQKLVAAKDGYLVVVSAGMPVGVLDERLLSREWPSGPLGAHRRSVGEIIRQRVRCVMPHVGVAAVAQLMVDQQVDAVPVVDRLGAVLGVVTARDVVREVARAHSVETAPGR